MMKISDALRTVIMQSPFLRFGLSRGLLNLSQLARFLQPLIEARTKKHVKPSAILMSLSRLARGDEFQGEADPDRGFEIGALNVHSGLVVYTFYKNSDSHKAANQVYRKIQHRGGFITITEGITEITIITEDRFGELFKEDFVEKPKHHNQRIASLSVKFHQSYVNQPGFLYSILQQITLQGINVVEVASTATEFILYLEESDVQLAFDTLYGTFSSRESHRTRILNEL
ncbi:MAG: hypothetical protein KDD64_01330 [Bdellovibrionales bacterium]|nr:hypothetical protein [Bdellovibrionales bacterium]